LRVAIIRRSIAAGAAEKRIHAFAEIPDFGNTSGSGPHLRELWRKRCSAAWLARSVKGAWLAISAPAQRRAAQGVESIHYFIQQSIGERFVSRKAVALFFLQTVGEDGISRLAEAPGRSVF